MNDPSHVGWKSLLPEEHERGLTRLDQFEEKLKAAFSDDAFSAFAKLVQLKWTGEPVDVYANEIRRLAGLAKFVGAGLENVVKLTFVNGFPDNIKHGFCHQSNKVVW